MNCRFVVHQHQIFKQDMMNFLLKAMSVVLSLGLEEDLSHNLFGQPLVTDIVVNALSSHFNKGRTYRRKPLVLSFHGWKGGGKTFVARIILKHVFKKGTASRFAKMYQGEAHFPLRSEVDKYKVID